MNLSNREALAWLEAQARAGKTVSVKQATDSSKLSVAVVGLNHDNAIADSIRLAVSQLAAQLPLPPGVGP